MTHYHIRWSGNVQLDWERFDTPAEAEAAAKQLLRHGETYTIEEHNDTVSAVPGCQESMIAPLTAKPARSGSPETRHSGKQPAPRRLKTRAYVSMCRTRDRYRERALFQFNAGSSKFPVLFR